MITAACIPDRLISSSPNVQNVVNAYRQTAHCLQHNHTHSLLFAGDEGIEEGGTTKERPRFALCRAKRIKREL